MTYNIVIRELSELGDFLIYISNSYSPAITRSTFNLNDLVVIINYEHLEVILIDDIGIRLYDFRDLRTADSAKLLCDHIILNIQEETI